MNMADTKYNVLLTILLLLIREILRDSWYALVSDFFGHLINVLK